MQCPTLEELPAPPAGNSGWPWTEQSERVPETQPDGSPWPRISIVTPSFNQGAFIEETIRAVLLQGYPDIEYIVIDGGSQDKTPDILNKYAHWLSYWVSEPDRGQAHAINKGFEKATGQIYYWINSDDWPAKEVFVLAARYFQQQPALEVLYGNWNYTDESGRVTKQMQVKDFKDGDLIAYNAVAQPTVFFRSNLWRQYGPAKETLHYIMDYELWIRWFLKGVKFKHYPNIIAFYRLHENSKTLTLMRIDQNETVTMLQGLKASGQLPARYYKDMVRSLERMCRNAYTSNDYEQFKLTYRQYRKEKSRPDPFLLLVRRTIFLGKPFNKLLLDLRSRFLGRV